MRPLPALPLLLPLLAAAAPAQIVEISSMTVPHAAVDMDAVGNAGTTSRGAVNRAGTNGGADLVRILPTHNPGSIQGVYDTGTSLGRALAFDAARNALLLVDPNGVYDPFDLRLDLAGPSTEVGIGIGDWEGGMLLDFFMDGQRVASHTSTPFDAQNGRVKFFQARGLTFDRVDLSAPTRAANWVVAELHVESDTGYRPFGQGCAGSAGTPTLDAAPTDTPVLGRNFTIAIGNLPAGAGSFAIVYGFSNTTFPGLGSLPFDLGVVGAPGCRLLCDLAATAGVGHSGGTGSFTMRLPNIRALAGTTFYNQAYVLDPGANGLGVTVTNGGEGRLRG